MPANSYKNNSKKKTLLRGVLNVFFIALSLSILGSAMFSFPLILAFTVKTAEQKPPSPILFPVTVDPEDKTIAENPAVDNYLDNSTFQLQAAAENTGGIFWKIFEDIAIAISNMSLYQNIAAVNSNHFIFINPGLRKEQVAELFAKELGWNNKQKQEFLTPIAGSNLPLTEGSFFPGLYVVDDSTTPEQVQALFNQQFSNQVLSHYGASTSKIVPLNEALTMASLIQRETIGTDDMRLVSGILWNRLFDGMKLQVDSTLQYAAADSQDTSSWWPDVTPRDKYIKSVYNTYLNSGLPPAPIASPSVDAILAALNPIKTDCLYYFNDRSGNMHCSATYAEHLKLLKQYY